MNVAVIVVLFTTTTLLTATPVPLTAAKFRVTQGQFAQGDEVQVVLVDAGASCVIQPGGSMRDDEVIAAADERGIAMVFTGTRHFRH